jgi:hypothetical protein
VTAFDTKLGTENFLRETLFLRKQIQNHYKIPQQKQINKTLFVSVMNSVQKE